MTYKLILTMIFLINLALSGCATTGVKPDDAEAAFADEIKNSLVLLSVSVSAYENLQPWKLAPISGEFGYACAVAPYQVLTTAQGMINASYIKARRYGQNEFIPVEIKAIDYEANLCLLELDRNVMTEPLKPLTFCEEFEKDANLTAYWLSSAGQLSTSHAILDRAEVNSSAISYSHLLDYVVANSPQTPGRGRLFCHNNKPIGIAYWSDSNNAEAGLAPAHAINMFLEDAQDGDYKGFPVRGFLAQDLIDPAIREYLKMPSDIVDGIYITKVWALGTGSEELKASDVIVAIDDHPIDSHGRFKHPVFDYIPYHYLITNRKIGEEIMFDIFREGEKKQISVTAKNFDASEMLVPYYEYSKQPEYIVTAGYVIQKLTRPYLMAWGEGAPPHLTNYYQNHAFNPTDERKDIVVLSYIFPTDLSLGYHSLGRIVVDKYNGMKIKSMKDVLKAMELNPGDEFDTITFEHDYPTVVIDRSKRPMADMFVQNNYGVKKLINVIP